MAEGAIPRVPAAQYGVDGPGESYDGLGCWIQMIPNGLTERAHHVRPHPRHPFAVLVAGRTALGLVDAWAYLALTGYLARVG